MRNALPATSIAPIPKLLLLIGLALATGCAKPAGAEKLTSGYQSLQAATQAPNNAEAQRHYSAAEAQAAEFLNQSPAPRGRYAAEALYLRGRALEGRAEKSDPTGARPLFVSARDAYNHALQQNPPRQLHARIRAGLATGLGLARVRRRRRR